MTLNAEEMKYETDKFKYIPKGTPIKMYDLNGNEKYELYWWDKNKNEAIDEGELFIDLNEDGIPDLSYKEFLNLNNLRNSTINI